MSIIEQINNKHNLLQAQNTNSKLYPIRSKAYTTFNELGIPTVKNEEWKYTRIAGLFNNSLELYKNEQPNSPDYDWSAHYLPEHNNAYKIVFINGCFSQKLSEIDSDELVVLSIEDALNSTYKNIAIEYFGDSLNYTKDGLNTINTALVENGLFLHVKKNKALHHPIHIYHIKDSRAEKNLLQGRILIHISENTKLNFIENHISTTSDETVTNLITEVIIEKGANVTYYKIQNDNKKASQINTTHFRLIGESTLKTITVSLDGYMVRNNLNIIMDAPYCEAILHGIYFPNNNGHIDNHTTVDNIKPNCTSKELYKGIMTDMSTGVFNGKILVQKEAQKTNAFQSNKNILLSDNASINGKPQLEILADDVKCSHGCTIGQLNEETLFYLQSRGIDRDSARSLLIAAFTADVLEHIDLPSLRDHAGELITKRLQKTEGQ